MSFGERALLLSVKSAHVASLLPAYLRFERACRSLRSSQAARLRAHLRDNADTAYGRQYGFGTIDSVAAFQARVPVVDYDAMRPWIDRIARGEAQVLTQQPVRIMERTGGSTATAKLVPFTNDLLRDVERATSPWLYTLHSAHPELLRTRSYWSVSPAARRAERTEGGLRIGFEDDTEYFGPLTRFGLRLTMAVPGTVARLPDMDTWRRVTLHHLLAAEDLGFVSIWNPSFLTLLMAALERDLSSFLADLPTDRARDIAAALDRTGAFCGEALWPNLAVLSCWTDGPAEYFLPALRRYFPRTLIQGKGLFATEGVVSIPLGRAGREPGAVLAATSHFFEFLDLDTPSAAPRLADQLRVGERYSPILTTGGGFSRYHLKDVVVCTGHYRGAPRLRFEGKLDRSSDLCGEKLHERDVHAALHQATSDTGVAPSFALLTPQLDQPPHYVLYVEASADDTAVANFAHAVDATLLRGHHYRYCRDLGQLGAMRAVRVADGQRRFEQALLAENVKAGDIKPAHLDLRTIWAAVFADGTTLTNRASS